MTLVLRGAQDLLHNLKILADSDHCLIKKLPKKRVWNSMQRMHIDFNFEITATLIRTFIMS